MTSDVTSAAIGMMHVVETTIGTRIEIDDDPVMTTGVDPRAMTTVVIKTIDVGNWMTIDFHLMTTAGGVRMMMI